ncbi:MAG TPA: PilT/PilU family type 4a pilus ATPase [Bryobacteraceae bacterium]|nr:PilT/PilU family type 4a pilus ATPase [Bryobacteraceae bacterium]
MPAFDNELERIVTELNRAAPGSPPAIPEKPPAGLEQLLGLAAERHASDVLLVADCAPALRAGGNLVAAGSGPLSAEEVQNLLFPLLTQEQRGELSRRKSLDFSFMRSNGIRCRANLLYQRGTVAACIRLLPARVPSLESLHLPPALAKFIERRQGLILVTGPTGCGKTTTLAALIELVNKKNRFHIVTIEDPIEYHYTNAQSIVEQIEVGRDTPDFGNSLRSILRQNPDVILVGEMRDAETMATVLTAAETGHLVFSTLHTNDTGQAISRILDAFPTGNQAQIRQQLSLALTAVVAQQLVPGMDGNARYPAVEIMAATDAVRSLIRRGDDHQLRLQISTGRAHGMMTMEQSLAELVRTGIITKETALAHCLRADDLRLHLE